MDELNKLAMFNTSFSASKARGIASFMDHINAINEKSYYRPMLEINVIDKYISDIIERIEEASYEGDRSITYPVDTDVKFLTSDDVKYIDDYIRLVKTLMTDMYNYNVDIIHERDESIVLTISW